MVVTVPIVSAFTLCHYRHYIRSTVGAHIYSSMRLRNGNGELTRAATSNASKTDAISNPGLSTIVVTVAAEADERHSL